MDTFGTIISGLGFFFLGLHMVGDNLRSLSSGSFRTLIARFTHRDSVASVLGVLFGLVMQSTSAVTFILTSMVDSGLITVRGALPIIAWTNVGATLLAFVVAVNIDTVAHILVGLTAIVASFSKSHQVQAVARVGLGVGLLFLGLDAMETAAVPLQKMHLFHQLVEWTRYSYFIAFFIGALLSFLTQSKTAAALIAISLANGGALGVHETMMIIYGANIGSSFSRMLLAAGTLTGSARQLARFQDVLSFVGAAVFVVLFYIELYFKIPLVFALAMKVSDATDTRLAMVYFVSNVGAALMMAPILNPMQRWLVRQLPASAAEKDGSLKYLRPESLNDPATAMDLLTHELARLLHRIQSYSEAIARQRSPTARDDVAESHRVFASLQQAIGSCLADLTNGQLNPHLAERLAAMQAQFDLTVYLEEGVRQLAGDLASAPDSAPFQQASADMLSALDRSLVAVVDAARELDASKIDILRDLCRKHGSPIEEVQTKYFGDLGLDGKQKAELLGSISDFERIVWMLRKLAKLLRDRRKFLA